MTRRSITVALFALAVVRCAGAPPPRAFPLARCTYDGDCGAAEAACDAGDANGCLTLGYLYGTATVGAVRFHQPERGEAYLARACGIALFACYGVVDVAETQRALCDGDYAGETRLVEGACEKGYPPACAIVANKLVDGVDLPRDTARAARLYATICDADDRFSEFVEKNDDGAPVPHADPLEPQVAACVRSRRLVELGLAGDVAAPQRSPEQALALEASRAVKYREPRRWPPDRRLDEERRAADAFAQTPAERAMGARERRRPTSGAFEIGCRGRASLSAP